MTNTITSILGGFKDILDWIVKMIGGWTTGTDPVVQHDGLVQFVLSQPLLFIPIGVVAVYMLIKLFKRLF
jgi:hypothetical protein